MRPSNGGLYDSPISVIGHIELPKLDIDIALQPIEGGGIGNKVHQTARGVAPEQRALAGP